MSRWGRDIFGRFTALYICIEKANIKLMCCTGFRKLNTFIGSTSCDGYTIEACFCVRIVLMYCWAGFGGDIDTQYFCFLCKKKKNKNNTINRVCMVWMKLSQAVYNLVAIGKSPYIYNLMRVKNLMAATRGYLILFSQYGKCDKNCDINSTIAIIQTSSQRVFLALSYCLHNPYIHLPTHLYTDKCRFGRLQNSS